MQLQENHVAVQSQHTMYLKNVFDPATYEFKILKPSTNEKLGKKILKGIWSGMRFVTLTLEERATCDPDCEHWLDCFGNNMPFAHRFMATTALTKRMEPELDEYDAKNPNGYCVRLHILGDFFSVAYVKWWGRQLANRPALHIYGYCRHHPGKPIGNAVEKLRQKYPDRFKVRFSNKPDDPMSANSEHVSDVGTVCPEQMGRTESCGTCTLCWVSKKPIIFLDH